MNFGTNYIETEAFLAACSVTKVFTEYLDSLLSGMSDSELDVLYAAADRLCDRVWYHQELRTHKDMNKEE